ncbi:MAG TPA: hypothetical protein VLT13_11880 [Bacteroidota bacterium]|nr:hypothetical protein [Bacteroidota bacterium]
MKRLCIGLCIWAFLLPGCDLGEGDSGGYSLAIYRLADSSLTAANAWAMPLNDLRLADAPFLTLQDIRTYNWTTHEFAVTAQVDSHLAILRRTLGPTGGIPWVLTVDDERIYLGAFWYAHSSLMPQVPFIDLSPLGPNRIWRDYSHGTGSDQRADPRIYRVLKNAGVLVE